MREGKGTSKIEMTVKEFAEFASYGVDIILRDSCDGKQLRGSIENHLDRIVHGFYPEIYVRGQGHKWGDDYARVRIVAWVWPE